MRLHGKKVAEVDLSANHLTVFYGLVGQAFDTTQDPYAIPGRPRKRVKRWLTYALGTGSVAALAGQWYAKVRESVLARHSILQRLDGYGISTLDLQFHEAEVIKRAMKRLRDRKGVAVVPVFDSLVVPASKVELTRTHLTTAFTSYFDELRPCAGPIVPRAHIGLEGLRW